MQTRATGCSSKSGSDSGGLRRAPDTSSPSPCTRRTPRSARCGTDTPHADNLANFYFNALAKELAGIPRP
eukprot:1005354-Pyramimonas_sp.AAC.1